MYCVLRRYDVDPANVDAIVHSIESGGVPLLRSAGGFVSYSVAASGNELLTISVYQDKSGADESVRIAADYVKEHLAPLFKKSPTIFGGDVKLRVANPTTSARFGVMRRYSVNQSAMAEIVSRAQAEFLPLIQGVPGLARYTIVDEGDGHLTSLSAFDSKASAEESTRVAGAWVRDNLAVHVQGSPEVVTADIKLSVLA